ncbi:VOC family protein [Nocardia inohanensis]|uniref:VOC family protein n=1 Tax=Nocardia inohanensis TaxID=209246 RepID=UPI0008337F57|nr:VOC family protein [Nocardia inohanensis]
MTTLNTFIWFDNAAEQAAEFYAATVPGSKIVEITRNSDGSAFIVTLELAGQAVTIMNGGPDHPLTDAISLQLVVDTQEEIDQLWAVLTEGGAPGPCGWLTDRYGLSWQIAPSAMPRLMNGEPEQALAVAMALRSMSKIDVKVLQDAYDHA